MDQIQHNQEATDMEEEQISIRIQSRQIFFKKNNLMEFSCICEAKYTTERHLQAHIKGSKTRNGCDKIHRLIIAILVLERASNYIKEEKDTTSPAAQLLKGSLSNLGITMKERVISNKVAKTVHEVRRGISFH
jgi:hypothetical protein